LRRTREGDCLEGAFYLLKDGVVDWSLPPRLVLVFTAETADFAETFTCSCGRSHPPWWPGVAADLQVRRSASVCHAANLPTLNAEDAESAERIPKGHTAITSRTFTAETAENIQL
jgi:hypothetical protein